MRRTSFGRRLRAAQHQLADLPSSEAKLTRLRPIARSQARVAHRRKMLSRPKSGAKRMAFRCARHDRTRSRRKCVA